MRWISFQLELCLWALAAGCSGGAAAPGDAGADAGPPTCASDLATPEQPCGALSWSTSATASRKRNHHATYLVHAQDGSPFLVAVAGVDANLPMNHVDVAPIAADGSVGAFVAGPDYPIAVGGLTGEVAGGVVVAAGGRNPVSFTDRVFTSVVQADGSPAPWQEQPKMNRPRMHAGSFAVGARVYVLGGFASGSVWDDVIAADVAADGSMGAWSNVGTMPGPLTHFGVSVANGYVFVTGGISQDPNGSPPNHKNVWRGTIEADGTLDGWTQLTPLPTGLSVHGSFVYGGYLYVAGGLDDTVAYVATVRRAPIQPDHSLGPWELAAPLPLARGHVHQLPIEGNHVYSVSGAVDFNLNSTDALFVGTLK